jgi:tRNA (guanine37-N1)-methyltransferase
MILRVDVVDRALKSTKQEAPFDNPSIKLRTSTQGGRNSKLAQRTVLLDPQGIPFAHDKAQELSTYDHLILICGHYEGVDERIRKLVNEELSVGDYILTGGEIAAIVVVDSVARLIPGVIRSGAARTESFAQDTLEYPQYTRPERHKTWTVPQILMSGNHARIHTWRLQQSRKRTRIRRPDLIQKKKSRT